MLPFIGGDGCAVWFHSPVEPLTIAVVARRRCRTRLNLPLLYRVQARLPAQILPAGVHGSHLESRRA